MIWLDAQLSPHLAVWISERFGVPCKAVRDLGLRDAKDLQIFHAARVAGSIILTKDGDFALIQGQIGAPPPVLWLTCGNTSNAALREILASALPKALALLADGEILVEIRS